MWSGPKSRYYSSVHVEGLKKFTKTPPKTIIPAKTQGTYQTKVCSVIPGTNLFNA
jgi:hypothetical protein